MAEARWTQIWPKQYIDNPKIEKPLEEIWDEIDNYSWEEVYANNPDLHKSWRMTVVVPPFEYEGKFVKGIFYSLASKQMVEKYPKLRELFFVGANSMFSSYPHNHDVDYFLACYDNKAHENYYKAKHPETKKVIFVPLHDADWVNEKTMAPVSGAEKKFDVICVTAPFPVKNLPIFAKALKVHETKYHKRLKVAYGLGSHEAVKRPDGSLDYSKMGDYAGNVLKEVDRLLGDTKQYIDFEPHMQYSEIAKWYSAAKCCVLASLIEGKNRSISEAMACNTPIVVFRDHNKYLRGSCPVFVGNSGEYVPGFTAEDLADTIHKVISNPENYSPRKNLLSVSGRRNFVNTMVDANDYYRENLPDYRPGGMFENAWVKAACQDNYQISFEDFVYSKKPLWQHVGGEEDMDALAERYLEKFKLAK